MKKNFVSLLIIIAGTLAIILFVCLAPTLIRTTISSENQVSYDQPIPSVAHGYVLSQQFTPQHEQIQSLEIYTNSLACDKTQGYLSARILDSNHEVLYENQIPLSQLPDYGLSTILKDMKLQTMKTYELALEAIDTTDDGPAISFYPTTLAASTEENNASLFYAGLPMENSVLRIVFHYSIPLSAVNIVIYCLFILFLTAFAVELCNFYK